MQYIYTVFFADFYYYEACIEPEESLDFCWASNHATVGRGQRGTVFRAGKFPLSSRHRKLLLWLIWLRRH